MLKAAGPVFLGGRTLPSALAGVLDALAPAVLAALVVTQLVAGDRELVLDERLGGIAVGRRSRSRSGRRSSSPSWSRPSSTALLRLVL